MIWQYGRAFSRVVFAFATGPLLTLLPSSAAGQGDEEVIVDPELQGPAPGRSGGQGDEVIQDPDLAGGTSDDNGWGDVFKPHRPEPPTEEDAHDPQANTGIARIEADGQFATDLKHDGKLEDAYESRMRLDGEIDFRRSRRLRLSVGMRLDFLWALPAAGDADLTIRNDMGEVVTRQTPFDQDRFELDVIPLSGYVDTTLGNGFHLRVGMQPVSTATVDAYSPNDILAAQDLRPQPMASPGSSKLAQPAVRVDWDLSSWATLQAIYVPWFMPHLQRPTRDRAVGEILGSAGARSAPDIDAVVPPSYQTKLGESAMRFVGPAPDFKTPQAQLRLSLRGSGMQIAANGGVAHEKMPSVYMTPKLERLIQQGRGQDSENLGAVLQEIESKRPVFDVAYHRFYQLGLDGSFDIAPVTVGFELAYSPARHLWAATSDRSHLPQPNVTAQIVDWESDDQPGNVRDKKIRRGVPVFQAAVHLEWLEGETFALVMEGFWINALVRPYDRTRDWLAFMPGKGAFGGGLVGMNYSLDDGRWRIGSALVAAVGPSFIFLPNVEFRARDGFYLNCGANLYQGPDPSGAQSANIGGLFKHLNQVFFGFRYLP